MLVFGINNGLWFCNSSWIIYLIILKKMNREIRCATFLEDISHIMSKLCSIKIRLLVY